jgi:hypothetical protein
MNGNQADQLLAALKDDIEWPAASLRLIHNHLEPLQEACSDDPELLGRVVELRRRGIASSFAIDAPEGWIVIDTAHGKGSVELLVGLIGWGHDGSGFRQPHGLMLQR